MRASATCAVLFVLLMAVPSAATGQPASRSKQAAVALVEQQRAEMTRMSERRVVKEMKSRRPASVWPRARYRGSALEWPGSLRSTRGRLKRIS